MKEGVPQTLDNEETKLTLYNYPDYSIILNGKFVSATDENLNIAANASDPKFKLKAKNDEIFVKVVTAKPKSVDKR
ncbi:hypothetical protein LJK88_35865 [Paenibacillus sp. P26]|nr:hypothetical protein LJK88_35865 [Paenibacillus sp. P26]